MVLFDKLALGDGHVNRKDFIDQNVAELPKTVPGQMNALGCYRNEQPIQQD